MATNALDDIKWWLHLQPGFASEKIFTHEQLTEIEKSEPWWHKADKDDLASFVAKKSLEHVENCDLPQPHGKNFRRGPFYSLENFNIYGLLGSYLDKNGNPTSVNMKERQGHLDDPRLSLNASDGPFRNHDYGTSTSTKNNDLVESGLVSENSYSKAQLLAALRHSQTRARRAEEEAQKLQTERERITKLLFKQASHLFAYKHWLHLLRLENLFFQLKSSDHRPVSVLFPKQGKRVSQKQRLPRHSMSSSSAVSFALGLSLAGIGLLLGCTWVVLA